MKILIILVYKTRQPLTFEEYKKKETTEIAPAQQELPVDLN